MDERVVRSPVRNLARELTASLETAALARVARLWGTYQASPSPATWEAYRSASSAVNCAFIRRLVAERGLTEKLQARARAKVVQELGIH